MHFIKKIIKTPIFLIVFLFGFIQTQGTITPVILLENTEIKNIKSEFYGIEQNKISLFGISNKNEYSILWEYVFLNSKNIEIVSVLYGDITGSGEKELLVLNYTNNKSTELYIFSTKNNLPLGAPEIFELKAGKNTNKPIEAELVRWDLDKDFEIIVSFGSPERKIIIVDYVIDSIKIVESPGKEFLLNSYGPIDIEIKDINNDNIDDVYIYSNSTKLERKIIISNNTSEYDVFNIADKQIQSFIVYGFNEQIKEFTHTKSNQGYFLNNKQAVDFSEEQKHIYHLNNNNMLLISNSGEVKISEINEEEKIVHQYGALQENFEIIKHVLSLNKKQIMFLDNQKQSINLVNLYPPYQIEKINKIKKIKDDIIAEKKKTKPAEKTDTLIVNSGENTKIQIPQIKNFIFTDLETIKKPPNMSLLADELAFQLNPGEEDAGFHILEYTATYSSKPKLKETNINDQLIINTTTEKKEQKEKKVIYINIPPKLLITEYLDTIPIYSDFEAQYTIQDNNKNDKHTIRIMNQVVTNPLIIENNNIFWSPEKKDAGPNEFKIQISDGMAERQFNLSIYVDTTKTEQIYKEQLIATTNQEFSFSLPHNKGNKYNLIKKPENLRITKKGKIYWIPLPTQTDQNIIEILITNQLNTNKYILDIYVNSPPIISYRPTIEETIEKGEKFKFLCQSFDLNNEAKLNWKIKDNRNNILKITDYGEIQLLDTTIIDNILYTLELNDGIDKDVFNGILYINSPPQLPDVPNEYIELGDTLQYKLTGVDQNNEKPYSPSEKNQLIYSIIQGPKEANINFTNHLLWIPTPEHLGNNNFIIEITDSIKATTTEFEIFVNDKPSIVSVDSLSIEIGDTLKHLFFIEDLNQNSEFSYNIKTTLDEILFSRKTGTLTWIPNLEDLGLHNLEITVSDEFNQSADTQKLKIYVYKKPTLTNKPIDQAFVNVEYLYKPTAIDMYKNKKQGEDVFFNFINRDSTLSIKYNVNQNTLSWIPALSNIGTHNFELEIKDQYNHTNLIPFNIQVILSPCENLDTLKTQNIDTLYKTIIDSIFIKEIDTLMIDKIDSVFIEKIDTVLINKIDTISKIQIDSIFIEKRDTIKILIDKNGKTIKDKAPQLNIPYKKSVFERNNKK